MVFQDGNGYVHAEGPVRAPTVFDNLIHKGEMPVTIGIFIDPGQKEVVYDNRFTEYVTLGDTYSRFLLEEILPEIGKAYNLVDNRAGRAVCGMSDGGLASFTVAWERPDAFSKVITHIASYTRLRLGSEYPYLIRNSRGNPKPIRVFLQDGENDLNIAEGSWPLGNICMEAALKYARYDYRFEMGTGGHSLDHGGEIFPETLRWIWRDYPGVKGFDGPPVLDAAVGQWDMVINIFGTVRRNALTIAVEDGALTAKLTDEEDCDIDVTAVSFEDDILTYEYKTPESQLNWGKPPNDVMAARLRITGSALEGALSSGDSSQTQYDFPVSGRKKGMTPDAE
jgi:enterochelin esterase family protein